MPASVKATYNAILYYEPSQYTSYFASNSRRMPSCKSVLTYHECQDENCLKAMIKDAIFVKLPHCASFFVKLHFVAALFGGQKFIKDLRNDPLKLFLRIIQNTIGSCGYWVIGVHCCIRLCSCFSRVIIKKFYHIMDKLMRTETNHNYEVCNEKNLFFLLLMSGIVGRYNICSEPKARRTEMTVSMIWYLAVQVIRQQCGLETYDDDKYHWLLGAKPFVSFILAAAVGVNIYVYCKDAKYVKSMERSIIEKYLIK